ncbi:ABC transporter substrate-binding protein [Streptosporangium sp. NBC_01810]|uniref:ABC transporter substrate-binding protein n=1 Tax=Streptosporangium sp. NBC_01810 TaxID=2975951 RepID=UPI002DD824EB|nr:ABC transporter substrate-binding protein [Streptosporangium sp. NBC_01810]WSA27094.1 ABC transporter substrate-binding protein [Streptosporangium sp. NBC_01810]
MRVPYRGSRVGRAIVLLLAPATAITLAACTVQGGTTPGAPAATDAAPKAGGTLTVVGGVDLTTLDPSKGSANTMALIGSAVYDTLMAVPKIGDRPEPNLAKSLVESDDQMSWEMTLPTGVQFSDGTPFNAEAVKFNLDRNRAEGSTAAALLSSIDSVEAKDDSTVVIKMKQPFSNLPYVFAYDGSGTAGYVASPTALKQYGDDYTAHAAGVGPYKLQSWSPGSPVELVRNPNYWNKNKQAYLDKVLVKTIADPQSAYQALLAGDADLMATTSSTLMKTAKANTQVNFVQGVGGDQDSIILNVTRPPFDDQRIRQAVSKALNRQEIVDLATEGLGKPAVSLFPEGNPFHGAEANPEYDLAGAKELIKAYETETGKKASFTYTCNNARAATDVIVSQLKAAGFDVKLDALEGSAWLAQFFGKKYESICWTMAGFLTPDLLPYRFLHSSGDLNTGGFKDAAFDEKAEAARVTGSPEEQKKLWNEADAVLTSRLPWVWTTSAPIGFIWSKRVHSVDLDEPGRLRYSVPSFLNAWVSG